MFQLGPALRRAGVLSLQASSDQGVIPETDGAQ